MRDDLTTFFIFAAVLAGLIFILHLLYIPNCVYRYTDIDGKYCVVKE